MATWADGMITVHRPYEELKEVVEAFRNNGGEGKPVFLKVQLSYAKTDKEALEGAHDQWRTNIFHSTVLGDLWQVEQFDELGKFVQAEELRQMVRISPDIQQHVDWIAQDMELGFERIILHNVNRQQESFIETFGQKVLPQLQPGDLLYKKEQVLK
jgi:alkanesulfonate monooxygenase SsuD/methylene tetrahydromethanopterin reductase-like flavin-dependent oxidoreductase (luciferase family)